MGLWRALGATVLVASVLGCGGAPRRWHLNELVHPNVHVQVNMFRPPDLAKISVSVTGQPQQTDLNNLACALATSVTASVNGTQLTMDDDGPRGPVITGEGRYRPLGCGGPGFSSENVPMTGPGIITEIDLQDGSTSYVLKVNSLLEPRAVPAMPLDGMTLHVGDEVQVLWGHAMDSNLVLSGFIAGSAGSIPVDGMVTGQLVSLIIPQAAPLGAATFTLGGHADPVFDDCNGPDTCTATVALNEEVTSGPRVTIAP
jgi:hypothetical protein